MPALELLADDQMPGVEACAACLRDAEGRVPALAVHRHRGRGLSAADLGAARWLLVRSVTRVDQALLAGSAVRFVGTATIGTDHLDKDWLDAAGIAHAAAPGCNARAVAEWVVASLVRQAAGQGVALAGRHLGIVGYGQVGRQVAALSQALGLRVSACDPLLPVAEQAAAAARGIPLTTLDALLPEVDMLTLHTPLTRSGPHPTLSLLDRTRLAKLRPDAWLLNAGRGEVIDNPALVDWLTAGRGVALLDVWANEPQPLPALLAAVRQASPHIAGHSLEGKWRGTWQVFAAAAAASGWMLTGSLEDILPAAGALHLDLPAPDGASDEARLHAVLARVIDLAGDDARLRLAQQAPDRGIAFDALRKGYGLRREFPAHVVTVDAGDPLADRLRALGFQVVARRSTDSTPSA